MVGLQELVQAMLDRHDNIEQIVLGIMRQSAQMSPPLEWEVASPFNLEPMNNKSKISINLEEEVVKLKEVLKRMTKAEPWMDIHGLTLSPKA